MSPNFNIPNDQANELSAANKISTKIVLPFAVLPVWWKNGAPAYKATGNALYFGGWGSTASEAESALNEMQIDTMPAWFDRTDTENDKGVAYTAYFCRYVVAAVIARRQMWMKDPNTGKSFSKLNVLVYLASHDKQAKKFVPWGFGVLSASSWSGVALADAIAEFDRATAEARKQYFSDVNFKNGLPYNYFFAPLGTFQKEPVKELKGKKGAQSPITPCQVMLPEKISEANITSWYVGDDIAAVMYDALLNAKEWLADWKNAPKDQAKDDEVRDIQQGASGDSEFPF